MLEEYVDFPELDVPDFSERNITSIEEVARQVSKNRNLDDVPIREIACLLETKGFVISSLKLDNRFIDDLGSQHEMEAKQYYSIVLGNDKSHFIDESLRWHMN